MQTITKEAERSLELQNKLLQDSSYKEDYFHFIWNKGIVLSSDFILQQAEIIEKHYTEDLWIQGCVRLTKALGMIFSSNSRGIIPYLLETKNFFDDIGKEKAWERYIVTLGLYIED